MSSEFQSIKILLQIAKEKATNKAGTGSCTSKFTALEISPSVEAFATIHGAIYSKELGWHVVGDVSNELEEFVLRKPRTEGYRKVAQCPRCGTQMELKQTKNGTLFWKCLSFSSCKATFPFDENEEPKRKFSGISSNLHQSSTRREATTALWDFARDVFGSEERAKRWLSSPKVALGGRRPIAIFQNPEEAEKVRELLISIQNSTKIDGR